MMFFLCGGTSVLFFVFIVTFLLKNVVHHAFRFFIFLRVHVSYFWIFNVFHNVFMFTHSLCHFVFFFFFSFWCAHIQIDTLFIVF